MLTLCRLRGQSTRGVKTDIKQQTFRVANFPSVTPGEPHIGDYLVRRPRGNVHRHPPLLDTQRLADIAMVNLHDSITTLVDITIASHNAQTAAADYTVGQAAAARTIDKRRAYDRDFETTNPNVNLVIFAVEDSGAVHPEAHQFPTCCPRQFWQRAGTFAGLSLCIHSSCSCQGRHNSSGPPLS